MRFMPPKERTIHVPEGGWVERAYYVVEVAMAPSNPVHVGFFHTGFLNGGKVDYSTSEMKQESGVPGGYHGMMYVPGEDTEYYGLSRLHYLRPIHLIGFEDDNCEFVLATAHNLAAAEDSHLPSTLDG